MRSAALIFLVAVLGCARSTENDGHRLSHIIRHGDLHGVFVQGDTIFIEFAYAGEQTLVRWDSEEPERTYAVRLDETGNLEVPGTQAVLSEEQRDLVRYTLLTWENSCARARAAIGNPETRWANRLEPAEEPLRASSLPQP